MLFTEQQYEGVLNMTYCVKAKLLQAVCKYTIIGALSVIMGTYDGFNRYDVEAVQVVQEAGKTTMDVVFDVKRSLIVAMNPTFHVEGGVTVPLLNQDSATGVTYQSIATLDGRELDMRIEIGDVHLLDVPEPTISFDDSDIAVTLDGVKSIDLHVSYFDHDTQEQVQPRYIPYNVSDLMMGQHVEMMASGLTSDVSDVVVYGVDQNHTNLTIGEGAVGVSVNDIGAKKTAIQFIANDSAVTFRLHPTELAKTFRFSDTGQAYRSITNVDLGDDRKQAVSGVKQIEPSETISGDVERQPMDRDDSRSESSEPVTVHEDVVVENATVDANDREAHKGTIIVPPKTSDNETDSSNAVVEGKVTGGASEAVNHSSVNISGQQVINPYPQTGGESNRFTFMLGGLLFTLVCFTLWYIKRRKTA